MQSSFWKKRSTCHTSILFFLLFHQTLQLLFTWLKNLHQLRFPPTPPKLSEHLFPCDIHKLRRTCIDSKMFWVSWCIKCICKLPRIVSYSEIPGSCLWIWGIFMPTLIALHWCTKQVLFGDWERRCVIVLQDRKRNVETSIIIQLSTLGALIVTTFPGQAVEFTCGVWQSTLWEWRALDGCTVLGVSSDLEQTCSLT